MPGKERKLSLNPYDDLFQPSDAGIETTTENQREAVKEIPLSELHPFKNHPFKVLDDKRMADTVESVKEYGILVPAIARPREDGGYELVSGHRRKRASELAGLTTMPVLVRELDDDAAVIVMVDSNLQRESILPSERAFAYKMKLEAIKHQGNRADLTSRQVVEKLVMADVVGKDAGESGRQVQRYIRLTELIPKLMDMVDERKIAFSPAVELSYLKPEEQTQLLDAMEAQIATPSLSQAQRLKKFSQDNKLSEDVMTAIMSEEKKTLHSLARYRPHRSFHNGHCQEISRFQRKRGDRIVRFGGRCALRGLADTDRWIGAAACTQQGVADQDHSKRIVLVARRITPLTGNL